jgi:hypothetical protein
MLRPHSNLPVARRCISTLQPRAAMSCRYALLSVFVFEALLVAWPAISCVSECVDKNTCKAFVNKSIHTSRYFASFHFLVISHLLRTTRITFLYFIRNLTDGATCLSQQMALASSPIHALLPTRSHRWRSCRYLSYFR